MPPQIPAAAITLQALHGLSDVETVQELRCDLRWKTACGLGLNDTAFDPRCWPTSAVGCPALPSRTASSTPSARSSTPPGCSRAGGGGRWNPPCQRTTEHLNMRSHQSRGPTGQQALTILANPDCD
ncbi:transposase [Streptomyces xanthochromogenes]|uniref:transposase n=1 Tax=Streptomyces xanthochromogenes TaxID=67384 RepID=UPI00341DCD72